MFAEGEPSIIEEDLLDRIGRGVATPPTFCNELIEGRFCSRGVEDRRSLWREFELGLRRKGDWGRAPLLADETS
jgi:hypothetical protein